MNLGIFLAIGESLSDLKSKGQLKRLIDYNINTYSKNFDKVYVFTYENENFKLPKNCILVVNTARMHRYLYSVLMPLIHYREIRDCDVLRGLQITGGIPAVVSKVLFGKNYIINYGYDYRKFARIEGKEVQAFLFPVISKLIQIFAYKVIITSAFLKKNVIRSKSVLIPNGVDTKIFKPSTIRGDNIIFVGRIVKQKNLPVLFKALKGLDIGRRRLMIVGDGPQMNMLKKLKEKLRINVKFYGVVNYKKLPSLYNQASIFVLPSSIEGNPKSLLEAMACGCVPIGNNVNGIKEIIKDNRNGLLINARAKNLRDSLVRVLSDRKSAKRLSTEARVYIEKKHNLKKLLSTEIALLKN